MSIVPFNCAVGDAKSITLAVASTVNIAPPDDSVDTNHVIIAGNGVINSFGFGPASIPITKEVWLHPSSGNITLVHSATLQLLGLANHVTANPTYGQYYYDGLGTWRELSYQDATTTAGGGGPQGPAGPQGPQGAQGAQGPPGQTGATGLTGPQGVQGPQGLQGQTGPQGSTGTTGPGYQATAPDYRNIAIGSTTFNIGIGYGYSAGQRARANPVQNIDYWMEGLVTSYNPSAGILTINVDSIVGTGQYTNWNVNLIGEIGQTGDTGATGTGGPPGPQGIQGVQGDVGPQGNTGPQGPIGLTGANSTVPGPQGPQGNTGPTGPQGPQGNTGPPGGLGEAPVDNNIYGRKNAAWSLFSSTAVVIISDTVPPAPVSGELWFDSVGSQMYVWFNDGTSSQWVPVVNQQGLPDAPSDGTVYVRGNNAWVHAAAPASTVPIIDGTATVGTSTAYARSDHIHPTDTSRVAKAGDTLTGPLILAADPTAVKGAVTKQYADTINTNANTKLPLAGGTLTGQLILPANPTSLLGAVPKQYVDSYRPARNKIINGDMRVDQRNGGAAGSAMGYTVDRWMFEGSLNGKGTWQQSGAGAPGIACGVSYWLSFIANSNFSFAAADWFRFKYIIEANDFAESCWGTPNARPVSISFWIGVSIPGNYGICLQSPDNGRSYPLLFNVPDATNNHYITVTIPGDTQGNWPTQGNSSGCWIQFPLGVGTTYSGPSGAWAAANYVGVQGAVSVINNNGASYYISNVQFEFGNAATPFERRYIAETFALCQRYYELGYNHMWCGYCSAGAAFYTNVHFNTIKRAISTMTYIDQGNNGFPGGAPVAWVNDIAGFGCYKIASVTGGGTYYYFNWIASAEL